MAEQGQDDQLEDTYRLCEDTGCSPEDLPEAMNHRVEWRAISVLVPRQVSDSLKDETDI